MLSLHKDSGTHQSSLKCGLGSQMQLIGHPGLKAQVIADFGRLLGEISHI